MGPHGSLLVTRDAHDRHYGLPVKVADTVGAGDAFTAALVHFFLQDAPLQVLNEAGNQWGSWVASHNQALCRHCPMKCTTKLKQGSSMAIAGDRP